MFKIEDFGHVLAIAFGLSAIFYYVDLREVALEHFKQTLEVLEAALRAAEKESKNRILEAIVASVPSGPGGMTSLARRTEEQERKLAGSERQKDVAMLKWWLLGKTARMIANFQLAAHVLAVLSTAVSLGSLIYSGFHHDEYDWKIIILILVLSFSSIIWNLGLYLLLLPWLSKSLRA